MPAPTVKVEKTKIPPQIAAIPHTMVLPKPQNNRSAEEKCTWGPHCLVCKKEEEDGIEDWNGDQQRNHHLQLPHHPHTYDVPD